MKDNRKKKRDSRFFIVKTFLALMAAASFFRAFLRGKRYSEQQE